VARGAGRCGGLGVGVLAQRERALDEQRVVADVIPLKRERLAGSQACVREDGEERGVALRGGRAHPLDGGRCERPDLLATREPRSADEAHRVGGDALGFDGALEDRAEQVERLTDRGGSGAGGEPVGLPARDRLGPDRAELERAEGRRDVMVVERRVVLARLGRERDAVRRRPRLGDELVERLAATVEGTKNTKFPPA
jgi:hypothetical protein